MSSIALNGVKIILGNMAIGSFCINVLYQYTKFYPNWNLRVAGVP